VALCEGEPASGTALFPLGGAWTGICLAAPDSPATPSVATLHTHCNFGYARGQCDSFAVTADSPDAVRFAIRDDRAGLVTLLYVQERGHYPDARGVLEFSGAKAAPAEPPTSAVLLRQAAAYLSSYRLRKAASCASESALPALES
jgi:hypothetical protein